jgi:hypothetical protein
MEHKASIPLARSLAPRLLAQSTLCRLVGIGTLVSFIATVYVYFASGGTFRPVSGDFEYYAQLAESFRAGKLHLLVEPEPELLALPDPYDPLQSGDLRLGDASLYKGRYYMYWGPAPALPHLAWQAVTRRPLHAANFQIAAALLSCLGFWLLLDRVRRSVWPATPAWLVWGSVGAFALGGSMLYLIGRPSVWHVSLLSAMPAAIFAWYCLLRGGEAGPHRRLWLLLTGVLLGWAIASRITYLGYATAVGLIFAARLLLARPAARRPALLDGLAFAAPLAIVGLMLMAYNAARFDNPFEFGMSYALQGSPIEYQIKKSTGTTVHLSQIPLNTLFYLAAIPSVRIFYPFFPRYLYFYTLEPPPDTGLLFPDYRGTTLAQVGEIPLVSVFILAPVALLALASPALFRARRPPATPATRLLLASLLLGLSLTLLLLGSFLGATIRYTADVMPALITLGTLVLLWWTARPSSRAAPALGAVPPTGSGRLAPVAVPCWSISVVVGLGLGLGVWEHAYPCAAERAQEATDGGLAAIERALGPGNAISNARRSVPSHWPVDTTRCRPETPLITDIVLANERSLPREVLHRDWFTIDGVMKEVLFQHPPATVRFPMRVVPERAVLGFSLALHPKVWETSDGVGFEVAVEEGGKRQRLFRREVRPSEDLADRRWVDATVDLSRYLGRSITLILVTDPLQSGAGDWAGWGALQLMALNAP